MNTPYYTTEAERLGHRIAAHAILEGNAAVASMPADRLGELGSYHEACKQAPELDENGYPKPTHQ
jgi:hypothetical protein